jgi:hypothetical protein
LGEFAVAGDTRRTTAGAARTVLRHIGKTVAAKTRPKKSAQKPAIVFARGIASE